MKESKFDTSNITGLKNKQGRMFTPTATLIRNMDKLGLVPVTKADEPTPKKDTRGRRAKMLDKLESEE